MDLSEAQVRSKVMKAGDVRVLSKWLFGVDLTPSQVKIVKSIAFPENNRISICCMTRYGKSYCVSIGVLLYIAFKDNKRVLLISPTLDQTKIIRNYISQFIIDCEQFRELVDIQLSGLDRLKSEVSKRRITFKNGCELQVLSAEGTAERLMGFGGDLIVLDESCLISYEVYRSKISRMLGDNPDSIFVGIGNPFHKNNQFWQHWINPDFVKIHIGADIALKEGRISETFLEEQRRLLTPIEYRILYDAEFPDEAEDSLFSYKFVQNALYEELPDVSKISKRIISCDVADKGIDLTVIMYGYITDDVYVVSEIYTEPKSENMQIAGKIIQWYNEKGADVINIDTIGVGVGVVSRVREVLKGKKVSIKACHYGEGVGSSGKEYRPTKGDKLMDRKSESEKKRFMNRKAEQYFRLKDLFEEGMIKIPKNEKLITELMSMRWELSSSGKVRIVDPETKSPDFADCLVYFIWKDINEIVMDFGSTLRSQVKVIV